MDMHRNQVDERPLWRRFALDAPDETEVGPDTIEAIGELGADEEASERPQARGSSGPWARLARALDVRRHARALAARPGADS